MKNIISRMNLLIFTALVVGSCRVEDPTASPLPTTDYSIINGDTVKTVKTKDYDKLYQKDNNAKKYILVGDTIVTYKEPKLHTPPSKDPDLSKIKNEKEISLKGKPLTMVVIGGSLSAGVRDGGYFNEGILTSYPNLIARQMKLKKFEQPLFNATEYNGIGRRVKTGFNPTGGPIQKFNKVQNNLGGENTEFIDNQRAIKLSDYQSEPDNLSIPFHNRRMITLNFGSPFKNRLVKEKNEKGELLSTLEYLKKRKFDFFILQTGIDDLINYLDSRGGGDIWITNFPMAAKDYTFQDILNEEEEMRIQPELKLLRDITNPLGAKGVLINIPDILEFPFFLKKEYVMNYNPLVKAELLKQNYFPLIYSFLPSTRVDSLLSDKVNIGLKPVFNENSGLQGGKDFIVTNYPNDDVADIKLGTQRMNDQLSNFSKKWGYGVVDIKSLYKKILSGTGYLANDGTLIDSNNFFSSDGINPTPLGQAVIANEVIRTINATYKTEIPLISVREYLGTK